MVIKNGKLIGEVNNHESLSEEIIIYFGQNRLQDRNTFRPVPFNYIIVAIFSALFQVAIFSPLQID